MLDEVKKMIMFFCSPFSVERQNKFLKSSECIGNILKMPASTNCFMDTHKLSKRVEQCRYIYKVTVKIIEYYPFVLYITH